MPGGMGKESSKVSNQKLSFINVPKLLVEVLGLRFYDYRNQ